MSNQVLRPVTHVYSCRCRIMQAADSSVPLPDLKAVCWADSCATSMLAVSTHHQLILMLMTRNCLAAGRASCWTKLDSASRQQQSACDSQRKEAWCRLVAASTTRLGHRNNWSCWNRCYKASVVHGQLYTVWAGVHSFAAHR
jgi:hypothetical protein